MPKAQIVKHPAERIGSDVKKSAWGAAIESLAIIILGILFIVWPEPMIKIVAYIVGIIFIVKGAFQVINYFLEKGQNDFFNNNLLIGVISVLIGIAALVIGEDIANIFRIVVGIWLIYEALARINVAIKLSYAGVPTWKYILIIALIIMVLGIFVIFNSTANVIGWMMVASGIIGIVGDILLIQQVDSLVDKITSEK